MKKLLFVCFAACLTSCSAPTFEGEIAKLIWETSGGGEIRFTVEPTGDDYHVHVESCGFKEQDVDLTLTPSDGQAFDVVKAIFTKQRNIHDDAFTPRGATGSWTSITLVGADGHEVEIENISTGGDLGTLYDFAAAGVEPEAQPESETEIDESPVGGENSETPADPAAAAVPLGASTDDKGLIEGEIAQVIWETNGGGQIKLGAIYELVAAAARPDDSQSPPSEDSEAPETPAAS